MAASGTVRVEGLRDLQRAFKAADSAVHRGFRSTLREVAEPVRADAELLAVSGIRRIGVPWSRMRVGVTTTSVYVAPRQRGKASRANRNIRRPNLADLLMNRAMEPALDHNRASVVEGVDRLLAEVGRKWETA